MGRVIELLDGLILADSGAPEDSRTASQSDDGRDVDDSYGSAGDSDSKAPPWP
jgi:hypothetical protein